MPYDAGWLLPTKSVKNFCSTEFCLMRKSFDKQSCLAWIKLLIYQYCSCLDPGGHSGCHLEYYKLCAICMLSSPCFNPITFQQIALDRRSHGQGICNAYKLTC